MRQNYINYVKFFGFISVITGSSFLILTSCRHYNLEFPNEQSHFNLAIGSVQNQTNEPRIGIEFRNKLSEHLMLSPFIRHVQPSEADFILEAKIPSYRIDTIGEVKINSRDSDQQEFRTSIFRVRVEVEFAIKNVRGSEQTSDFKKVIGTSEFDELVDIDVVRKVGLQGAIYDACHQIVVSMDEKW